MKIDVLISQRYSGVSNAIRPVEILQILPKLNKASDSNTK